MFVINKKVEAKVEENQISSKLPMKVDMFLHDVAQVYDAIDYEDIMNHNYSDKDIAELKKLGDKYSTFEDENEADKWFEKEALSVVKKIFGSKKESEDKKNEACKCEAEDDSEEKKDDSEEKDNKESEEKKESTEETIINILEDVRIPGTDVILEAGDKIRVVKEADISGKFESFKNNLKNLSSSYGYKLAKISLDDNVVDFTVKDKENHSIVYTDEDGKLFFNTYGGMGSFSVNKISEFEDAVEKNTDLCEFVKHLAPMYSSLLK